MMFSYVGEGTVIGSVGFNLHIGVALSLLLMTGPQPNYQCGEVFLNLFILVINCILIYLICNVFFFSVMQLVFIIVFMLFFGLFMMLPLFKRAEEDTEENDEHDLEDTKMRRNSIKNAHCFLPEVPSR